MMLVINANRIDTILVVSLATFITRNIQWLENYQHANITPIHWFHTVLTVDPKCLCATQLFMSWFKLYQHIRVYIASFRELNSKTLLLFDIVPSGISVYVSSSWRTSVRNIQHIAWAWNSLLLELWRKLESRSNCDARFEIHLLHSLLHFVAPGDPVIEFIFERNWSIRIEMLQI